MERRAAGWHGRRGQALRLLAIALLLVSGMLAVVPSGSTSAQASSSGARYEGVATCAGSTCHGRSEGNGAVVRQDEIASWQEPSSASGAHSRTYSVLASRRGRQIAETLGLGAATSAPVCLGCHATFVPQGQRGARFHTSDGVGCESCHGAAQGWLQLHYEKAASHASNIRAGLVPLENPQVRAKVCLDCHYGSSDTGQFVTHSMMAAGHPRISFELDLFSSLQQHHDEDADYIRRKPRTDSVRLWAVGQAEAVARATDLFARPGFGMRGMFPEFYFYDCHSCHRQITDGPARRLTFETNPGRPIPFGNPPFNDENIIMLSTVSGTLAPEAGASFASASLEFHRAMGRDRASAQQAAVTLRERAQALSNALAARSYAGDDTYRVIAAIASKATAPRFTDYAGSVQAVMAVDTLLNALVRERRVTVGAAAGIRANVNRAYAAVAAPETYRPAEFRSALASAAGAIGSLQ